MKVCERLGKVRRTYHEVVRTLFITIPMTWLLPTQLSTVQAMLRAGGAGGPNALATRDSDVSDAREAMGQWLGMYCTGCFFWKEWFLTIEQCYQQSYAEFATSNRLPSAPCFREERSK